jgi:N-terminal acetyltransferase B complex non-catalytic subunit
METQDDKYMWKAIVQLTNAQKNSGANYQLRFLLIKFFNHIGAVGPSQVIHMGLEIKHIQLDSLGYLMSRHIVSCGHFNETAKFYRNTLRFFTGNYKDTIDYIISAYRCGSFDKIREFIKLRDRLSASQHYASISIEQKLLDLLTETQLHGQTVQMMSCLEIDPEKDAPEWSVLTDNRDFKAIPSWDPIDRAVNDDLISESYLLEQKFLKFRSLTMRALATAVYISEDIHPSRIAASNVASKCKTTGEQDVVPEKLNDSDRASLLCPVLEK